MGEDVSIASWNLVADGLDCAAKILGAIADCFQDQAEWTCDLLAARSTEDFLSVWSEHSAKFILKSFNQREAAIEEGCRLWKDYAIFSQASGLSLGVRELSVNTPKAEVLSPDEEVLLLHAIE